MPNHVGCLLAAAHSRAKSADILEIDDVGVVAKGRDQPRRSVAFEKRDMDLAGNPTPSIGLPPTFLIPPILEEIPSGSATVGHIGPESPRAIHPAMVIVSDHVHSNLDRI